MAIVEGQKVKVRWNGKHKKYYESIIDNDGNQKYSWGGKNKEFSVDLTDLPKGSQALVKVICDYCEEVIDREYINYLRQNENNKQHGVYKDCCEKCVSMKIREMYGTLDEVKYQENAKENSSNKFSKEFLIAEFKRYYNEFGVFPTKSDLESNSDFPSGFVYSNVFGKWSNLLNELKILGADGWYKLDEDILKEYYQSAEFANEINSRLMIKRSIKEINKKAAYFGFEIKNFFIKRYYNTESHENKLTSSIEGLKDLFNDIGRSPIVDEYETYAKTNNLFHRKLLEKYTGLRYSEICLKELEANNKTTKTKEKLLNELIELKNKLGRTPRANELKVHGLSEKKAYMRKFNMRYQELIESLGWELPTKKSHYKTEEELLEDFYQLYKELSRIPNYTDINECNYCASYSTYRKHFDSIFNIIEILEIDISEYAEKAILVLVLYV